MDNAWRRYLDAASGATKLTRQAAETVVGLLVKQGEIAAEAAERYADELLRRSERNRDAVTAIAKDEVEQTVSRLGLARQTDVAQLTEQLARLEAQLGRVEAGLSALQEISQTDEEVGSGRTATKKTASSRTTVKKSGGS